MDEPPQLARMGATSASGNRLRPRVEPLSTPWRIGRRLPGHGHTGIHEVDVLLLAELPAEAGSEVVDVQVKRRTHVIDDGSRHSELIFDQALTIAVRVGGAVRSEE